MTILVTGAGGFVGSQVVRKLVDSGAEVVALVRPASSRRRLAGLDGIRIIEADLADGDTVARQLATIRPDGCIHLAWYAKAGKYLASPDNLISLRSSLSLLEELARLGCRHVVGVGTCFEYEMGSKLLHEDSLTKPATLYAASKLAFSLVAGQRLAQLGIGFSWARLFYLYGPDEDERRLVPAMIAALTAGREFAATQGGQVRDYLHVEDAASGLCALSRTRSAGTFNVCSGEPVTIARLMQTLGELLGRPDLVRLGALPYRDGDPMYVCGDNHRLRAETGWRPHYSLHDGLAATVERWKSGSKELNDRQA